MAFRLIDKGVLQYYTIDSFEDTALVGHLFSTRIGWNIDNTIDILSYLFNVNKKQIAVSKQVHGTNIVYVNDMDYYRRINKEEGIDGLITDKPNVLLVTYYADCVPLFFLDPKEKVVALAHAGWRGTLNNIGGKMVSTMIDNFNSDPFNILVGIAPSIGPCCYEVGKDVVDEFKEKKWYLEDIFKYGINGKYYLNLWKANENILLSNGIPKENITISEICTSCNVGKFYSYRREKETQNRMVAAIKLLE